MFCIMLSSLKSQKYACAVMRPSSQSKLTYKTSSQIEHTHLLNRDFKCHVHTLKFETPTSHSVCFSPVWPSHLGPCPFSPWEWHFTFSAPGNGILSLTPFGTYEQSSEYLNYLWTLSKISLPLLPLMMASISTYLLWYILSMFAHSTLRSWRSLEILKVCPEKERKSCLWSVGIPKKHQRSSIFSWLSSKKENWKKRTWKSAFSVELPQNWCSPSYPPVQSSWSLPVQKYSFFFIFVFDIW